MKEFKAGDRIRVYLGETRHVLRLSRITDSGYLFFDSKDNIGNMSYLAHRKQCRKLKKKSKPTEIYPGTVLADGTIYVGVLFDEARNQFYRLSMEASDEPWIMNWNDAMKAYGDRLPTAKEQSAMRGCLPVGNLPAGTSYYWSSTENVTSYAWIEQFSGGNQCNFGNKNSTYLVRCVKRFGYSNIQALEAGK